MIVVVIKVNAQTDLDIVPVLRIETGLGDGFSSGFLNGVARDSGARDAVDCKTLSVKNALGYFGTGNSTDADRFFVRADFNPGDLVVFDRHRNGNRAALALSSSCVNAVSGNYA